MIHVQDPDRGYSESVNFNDPAQGKINQLHGAGLRLGSINNDSLKPVIAVRNLGAGATTIAATVPYSKQDGKTGKISLPQLSLAPGEIKLFDTSNPQLKQRDFATAGLEIEYKGAPGSVIATANSVSQSGNQVFALPLKDPQGGMSSTGGYPWFIKETSSTVVFIKNVTNEAQEFMLNIIYPGGQWASNVRTLAAGQTFALDIRKLRDSQEKASNGSVIPPNATVGHVSWSMRGKQHKVLIGRAQTVDFANGLASTYECQCICGWSWGNEARFIPGAVTGFPGDVQGFQLQSRYNDCHGNDMGWITLSNNFLNNFVTHSSDNPSVATFTAPATGMAVAPGATYLRASWTEYYDEQDFGNWVCIAVEAAAACAAFCDVQSLDFTVAHDKSTGSPFGVRPTGIIAGTNGADPPITAADTQATVTVSTNPPTAGVNVTLSLAVDDTNVFTNGGHVNHTGTRPLGTLSQTSGTTNQNGLFTAVYTAPIFGGQHRIRATVNNVTKEVGIAVFFPGFSELLAGANHTLDGDTPEHPHNHYGTPIAVQGLPLICSDYQATYPGATNPEINDMSLLLGGKFEIAHNWGGGSHDEHRVGRNCDFETTNIPTNRWATLNQIFANRNVISVNDETATRAHWHLRFRP